MPALTYPCGSPPEPGKAVEIAPGVLWLRMPLPFALTHINLWALRDDADGPNTAGWCIVDSGVHNTATLQAWEMLLADDGALLGLPVKRVLITHMHPDHVGMAGWLTRRFDCRLWMSRLEYVTCRSLVSDTGREAPADGIRFYVQAGWNEAGLERYRKRFGAFGRNVFALPDSFTRLTEGDRPRIGEQQWQVVMGNGHSPEHACLYNAEQRLFIAGDQVLPRISSNISVHPTEPDADPLSDWLRSLDKLEATIPDDVLVLPSHNEPFHGLHARLSDLRTGHQRCLDRLRESLASPKRAVDVFGALFAREVGMESDQLGFATGESVAHLNHLLRRGEISREQDDHGVYWYRRH